MAILSLFLFLILSCTAIIPLPSLSSPHPHSLRSRTFTNLLDENQDLPAEYFQVTKPIQVPNQPPCASQIVLRHDFANTYGSPPFEVPYVPPRSCPSPEFSSVVLEWSSASKGRQFDRIFGIWLSGVEIFRGCTAEPTNSGIVWKVQKDITRFSSLLSQNQTLSVHLANIVDEIYTGVYHVNITFYFYPKKDEDDGKKKLGFASCLSSPADLILPISRDPPLDDAYWFLIENSTDVQKKDFQIPRNVYRAVLEVYVSYHANDEFWYANPPDEYIQANNLSGVPGNGAFREVVVSLNGTVVGAVWPFTVVYTGGINPLLWRPITGVGSFDLPSYDIEITPFLGMILTQYYNQTFEFSVTDALNVWYIGANLHLWIDFEKKKTKGKLLSYEAEPATKTLISEYKGLDGVFDTTASRLISSSGRVKTSYGKIHVHSVQRFGYTNTMKFGNNGNSQTVRQNIHTNYGVYFTLPTDDLYSTHYIRKFPLYLYTNSVDHGNGSYVDFTDVSLGFDEKSFVDDPSGSSFSSLVNKQDARGFMSTNGHLVTNGFGRTKEVYKFDNSEGCYSRTVSSSNYTILYDHASYLCSSVLRPLNRSNGSHSFKFGGPSSA